MICFNLYDYGIPYRPETIGKGLPFKFNIAHYKHPCTIWARQSRGNFEFLQEMFYELSMEFERRYGREHLSFTKGKHLISEKYTRLFPKGGFIEPVQAMPEGFRVEGDAVAGYRNFYNLKKSEFARWRHSQQPYWYEPGVEYGKRK